MSSITVLIFIVSCLLGLLTYIIVTTPFVPVWLAWVTGTLLVVMLLFAVLSFISDRSDKLEDFTNGR